MGSSESRYQDQYLGVYHWIQDQVNHVNQDASILSMSQDEFLLLINFSLSLASMRKHEMGGMQSKEDDVSPGKLKKESDWLSGKQNLSMLSIYKV